SNPTTQGVSIRNAGGSGAGRTLVMQDGIPLNDPFGGWVQWARVLPIEMQSVEIFRGGGSSLYGSGALSGAVNIISRRAPRGAFVSAEAYAGSQRTASASVFTGYGSDRWEASLAAGSYYTRGYIPVEA